MNNTTNDIETSLAYEKANYKQLSAKVGEYIELMGLYAKDKNRYFAKKCLLETELKRLINPIATKQAVIDWQAQ